MAQRFQSGARAAPWLSRSNGRRLRRLCAKIEDIASCGTILCHNRHFAQKWHRVFIPRQGRRFSHQVRAGADFGSSVPKLRKSLPMAQFCAIIGVFHKNGTEISFRSEGGALVIRFERAPPSESLYQNRGNRFLWHNFVP